MELKKIRICDLRYHGLDSASLGSSAEEPPTTFCQDCLIEFIAMFILDTFERNGWCFWCGVLQEIRRAVVAVETN